MSNLPDRSLRSKNSTNTNANANISTNNGSRMYTSPLDPSNNSKLSKPSANDLKSQLFDLQKKINSNRLSSPGKEPEIHLPPSIPTAKSSSSPTTASSPSSTSFSSIRQQRQQLHQQQQQQQQQQSQSQVSSLAFDKSSREPTQVNDPSALIRKKPSHNQLSSKNINVQSSPNPKPNSNVSFLSDLSDGLLLESRRLNSENSILKLNLKELKNNFDDTKKKLNNLTIINKQLSTQEEELKNKNWELETELSNSNDLLNQKLKECKQLSRENTLINKNLNELKTQFDSTVFENSTLLSNLNKNSNSFKNDLKDLNIRNSSLNDENDQLLIKLNDLSKTLESKEILLNSLILENSNLKSISNTSSTSTNTNNKNNLDFEFDNDDDLNIDNLIKDSISATQLSDLNSNKLEKQTLISNLQHANKTIIRLRSAFLKYKKEHSESTTSTQPPLHPPTQSQSLTSTSPVRHSNSNIKRRSRGLSPSKRTSKVYSYYENNDESELLNDNNWEDFENDKLNEIGNIPKLIKSDDEDDEDDEDGSDYESPENKKPFNTLGALPSLLPNKESTTLSPPSTTSNKKALGSELDELNSNTHSSGYKLTERDIKQYAINHNLILLPIVEYNELKKSSDLIENPSIEFIKQQCSKFELVPMTKPEYEKFTSSKSNTDEPTDEELIQRMESRGLKVLKLDEFDSLSSANKDTPSQLSNKSIEEYEIIMNENGYKILSESEYKKLNSKLHIASKQVELLQDNLHLSSNVIINNKEKSPRKKSILLGGGSDTTNSVPKISKDDYQNINNNLNSLKDSIKSMESNMASQKTSSNAKKSVGSIATGAASAIGTGAVGAVGIAASGAIGAVSAVSAMTNASHKSKSTTKDLSPIQEIEDLKQKANKHSLTVISKDEYKNIVSKIDGQALELKDIKSKLESKEIEFKKINDFLITKDQELQSIKEKLITPTADYVKEKASTHGLVVIPTTDHQDLNNKIQSHEEQIKDLKAKYDMKRDENSSLNSIIEQKNAELSNIETKLSNPDLDFVKEKAQSHGMVMIPSEHHQDLISNASETETKLKNLESELSNVKENHKSASDELLSKKIEIDNYNKKISNPEVSFVKDIAGNLGMIVVSSEDFNKLKENYSKTSEDLAELKNKLELSQASLDSKQKEITDKAKQVEELTAELNKLHEEHKTPDVDYIHEKASHHGMVVIPTTDHQVLQKDIASASSELSELKEKFKLSQTSLDSKQKEVDMKETEVTDLSRELSTKTEAYAKLHEKYQAPDVDYIHEKATNHGMIVVPTADHHGLKTDLKSASNELSELKKKLEATESSLVTKQKEIAAKHLEVEDLTKQFTDKTTEFTILHGKYQTPDVEYLHQKANNHQMVVVPTTDHHAMKADLLTSNTELEELSRKLKLTESSLEAKQKEISEKEEEIAGLSEKVSLKTEEFAKLHEKHQTPDIDYINQKAINHNMVVIPYAEHATLKSSVTNLNDESKRLQQQLILEEKETERLKHKLATKSEEITGLQQQLETPSVEFIRQKAVSQGYIIMSSHDHSELQKKLVASKTEIDTIADELENKRNEAAILKETVNQKNVQLKVFQKRLDKPEVEFIKDKAEALNMVVVPVSEIEHSKTALNAKIDEVNALSKKLKTQESTNTQLKKQIDESIAKSKAYQKELEEAKKKSSKGGVSSSTIPIPIPIPVPTGIGSSALSLGSTAAANTVAAGTGAASSVVAPLSKSVVPDNGTTSLVSASQAPLANPSVSYIKENASKHGMVVISNKDHSRMIDENKALETLKDEVKSTKDKLTAFSKANEELKLQLEIPSVDYLKTKAVENSMVLLPTSDLETLKSKIASKSSDYDQLKSQYENPELDYLHSKAADNSMVVIGSSEYDSLKKSISDNSKEIQELQQQLESPDIDYLHSKAKAHSMIVLPTEDHDVLKSTIETKSRELKEANSRNENPNLDYLHSKAEAQSMVVIPSFDYDNLKTTVDDQSKALAEIKAKYESPEIEYLRSKAAAESMVVVPTQEYDDLKKTVADQNKEALNLKSQLDSPTVEFLRNKAVNHSMVLIPSDDHESLNLTSKNYDALKAKNEKPDIDYLHSKAADHSMVVIPSEEHETLKSTVESLKAKNEKPDVDYLHAKAAENSLVVIPSREHESLKSTVESLKAKNEKPDVDYLHSKAADHSMVVIPSDEHETLKSTVESLKAKNEKPDVDYLHAKAAENSMVVIPSDEHEKLKSISADHDDIKSKNENPDIEYLKSKATIHSMVLLPVEEHDALKEKSQKYSTLSAAYENPELEYLNQKAEANSMILVTPEEYEKIKSLPELEAAYGELKAKYESPDLSYIKSYASTHDLIAIPIQIFNGMKDTIDENSKEIETLRNHAEHPEVDYLKQNANKHSMVVIPSKDHEDLKRRFESPDVEYLKEKATSHSMVVVSSEEHENLQKQILTPQQEYIVKKANEMNLHVISEEEYEEMVQKSETPSVDVCKKVLAANNMIVLSQVEYQTNSAKLTEYKTKLDSNHAKSLSITDEDVKTYKSTSDDVEVDSRIKALEETILNPGKQYIVEKAEMYDLIAIPKDEYKLSLAREPINKETITANASNFGLVAISSKEYSELVKSSEAVPSVAIAERILVSNGYVCLTEKEYKDILSKSNSGIGSAGVVGSIAGAGSAAGALIGNAIGNAIGNGGSLPSTQSFASAPTVSKSAGITSGAQTLPGAVYLSGLHKEENNVERRPVESFEQIPSSEDDDIYEDAEDDIDDDQDANSLFSITRLREEAGRLGFTLVKFDEFSDDDASIVDNTTTRVHDVSATEYNNSNILSINSDDHQVDNEPLKEDVDLPRLRALAATLGVTINESGGDSGSLKENGNRELSKEVAGNGNTGTIENMTKEELSEVASRFGFIVISKVEYERLRSPKITSEDLVAKASELHLTLLSDDEFEALKTQQDIPIEILEDQASKKGYLFISNDKFIATTVSRTADVNNVVVLPATYYNKLFKSHEWYKYNKDQLNQPPPAELKQPQQPLPQTPQKQLGSPLNGSPLSSGNDLESKSLISGAQVAGYQGTDNVVDSDPVRLTPDNFSISALSQAPSLHTIMTNMTFTSSEIIAVITQTIIGEYLFKYYRRLGPLSALSDTRHERYFWIHPYSLTLYWSNNNPVLSETSENKIRAMAIVSVESVEDNNPLPPGLYYKSIIIHSHDRSVKITCPSRQRHNIWYNAIRYLLQRSTADFLNDDEIENQYNENFEMDQKINVERSQSFRHSQPRQSILSSKRSFSTPLRRSNTGRTLSTRPPTLN